MADLDTRRLYGLVWGRINELVYNDPDYTPDYVDLMDEAERAQDASDYSTLVDLYDDLGTRLRRLQVVSRLPAEVQP